MDQALQHKLEQLKFIPGDMSGAMQVQLEDGIEVRAVTHPLYGLVLLGTHPTNRTITGFEVRLAEEASVQEIARALVQIYERVSGHQGGGR